MEYQESSTSRGRTHSRNVVLVANLNARMPRRSQVAQALGVQNRPLHLLMARTYEGSLERGLSWSYRHSALASNRGNTTTACTNAATKSGAYFSGSQKISRKGVAMVDSALGNWNDWTAVHMRVTIFN